MLLLAYPNRLDYHLPAIYLWDNSNASNWLASIHGHQLRYRSMSSLASTRQKKYLVLAVLLAAITFDSHAQFSGAMGGMRRSKNADNQGDRSETSRSASSAPSLDQIANQLLDLRMRLLITPEQSPTWDIFYGKFIDLVSVRPTLASDFIQQSALQVMQRQLALAQSRFALTENLYEATKSVYAQLSPEQQNTADQWLPKLLPTAGTAGGSRSWVPANNR